MSVRIPLAAELRRRRADHAAIPKKLAEIVEAGGLRPVLDENQYTLDEVGQAYARLESRQAMGKVVIDYYS